MAESGSAGDKKNPLGPAGSRVMANVRRLRLREGLTYKDLSLRLEELGRPIPVLGLSRLERGERRVDADDLVALAVALGCTPNALLLPDMELGGIVASEGALTPKESTRAERMWAWATGELPLGHNPASAATGEQAKRDEMNFILANRRHNLLSGNYVSRVSDLTDLIRENASGRLVLGPGPAASARLMMAVLNAFGAGVTTAEIRSMVEGGIVAALTAPIEETLARIQSEARQLADGSAAGEASQ